MEQTKLTPSGKPFDIHERLLLFACDIVRLTQYLHSRGPIARRLSYQILDAGTSVGSNAEEADGASSHDDFIAKNRIALKEAKETRFRLRVCQKTQLLSPEFYPLVQESDELVKILGKIVHNALRNSVKCGAAESLTCNITHFNCALCIGHCALIEHCAFGIAH